MLSSSVASGKSFLKVLGVEEEPHLVTVLIEKMSAVKELQTLSEDMSDWLSGSKQGIAALVCVLVMCLYYWSLGATDTQFTEKQAYYERIGATVFTSVLNNTAGFCYCIEQQQLVSDIERLTSDKADLLTRLECYEEEVKTTNECEKFTS